MTSDLADEVGIDRRRTHDVDDALAVESEVEEDAVVAELEIGVDEADLRPSSLVEGDRRVDRDGRRADPALGAVESQDPAHRRASEQRLARREAGEQALDPREQLGWMERLDEVVVGACPEAADLLLDLPFGGQHDDRDVDATCSPAARIVMATW